MRLIMEGEATQQVVPAAEKDPGNGSTNEDPAAVSGMDPAGYHSGVKSSNKRRSSPTTESSRIQQQIQELIQQQGSRIRPETSRTEATGFHTWSRNDECPRPSRKTKKPELGIPNLAEIITKAFRGRTPGSNQYSSQHSPTTFLTVSPHLGAPAAPTAVGDVEQSRAIFHPLTLCKDERANRRLTRKMWFLGQKPFPQHPRHYTNLTSQAPRKTSRDLQKVAKIKYATKYTPTTKRKFYRHRNMSPANRNSPPVFRPVPATSTRRKRSALSRWSMTAGISSENPRIRSAIEDFGRSQVAGSAVGGAPLQLHQLHEDSLSPLTRHRAGGHGRRHRPGHHYCEHFPCL